MATFILLTNLTDEGAKTIKSHPERIKAVDKELEEMGIHVANQWATLGPYDFVNVVEAPDIQTIARVSANLVSRGTIRITTLPAIPVDDFIAGLR
jgi:uncharacterized protein with GYD domain